MKELKKSYILLIYHTKLEISFSYNFKTEGNENIPMDMFFFNRLYLTEANTMFDTNRPIYLKI